MVPIKIPLIDGRLMLALAGHWQRLSAPFFKTKVIAAYSQQESHENLIYLLVERAVGGLAEMVITCVVAHRFSALVASLIGAKHLKVDSQAVGLRSLDAYALVT